MYAVFKTNGKQFKVAPGDTLKLDRVVGDAGSTVVFDTVLLHHDGATLHVGTPVLADMSVAAEIIAHEKDDKIIVFKKKRRHNYRRRNGHRQPISFVKITAIGASSGAKPAAKRSSKKADAATSAATEA